MNIFPSYLCNFHCPFCGIRKETSPLLPLDWLEDVLDNVRPMHITILGGEPMLLPDDYLDKLVDMCTEHTGEAPGLYTNGSIIKPILSKTKLTISFDPEDRERSSAVLNNILKLTQPFSFSTILTKNLVQAGAEKFEKRVRPLKSLKSIDLCLCHHFAGREDMAAPDVKSFVDELTDKRIRFLEHNKMKAFHEALKVLPDCRFLVETPDHSERAVTNTLEDARFHYERLKDEYNSKL